MFDDDWNEDQEAELRKFEWKQKQYEKARQSYPKGEPRCYCSKCGELLRFNSINYHEGWHIDGCD